MIRRFLAWLHGKVPGTAPAPAAEQEARTHFIHVYLPEPLEPDDELFTLPNVLLTPHIAGSMGNELHRMAALALDEVEHLAAGAPPRHPVLLADLARMA